MKRRLDDPLGAHIHVQRPRQRVAGHGSLECRSLAVGVDAVALEVGTTLGERSGDAVTTPLAVPVAAEIRAPC